MNLRRFVPDRLRETKHSAKSRLMDLAGPWLGTRVWERHWRNRAYVPVDEPSPQNVDHPFRHWFLSSLSRFEPIDTVLDFGCGSGVAAQVLAETYPDVRALGIDISSPSILQGRRRLKELGLDDRITLEVGGTEALADLPDDSYDVVISAGVLLYVGPDKIEETARHMGRIARKGIGMMEFHDPSFGPRGRHSRDGWARDYDTLFREASSPADVEVVKVPVEVVPAGRWPQYGYRVLITL